MRSRSTPGARRACKQGQLFAPISREGALVLNNVLLTVACATVFVGTLYPLALESVTGDKISVGPPYFNATFGPLMVPLLLAVPFGPLLAWKRGDLLGALQRILAAAGIAVLALVAAFAFMWRGPWLAPFGIALGVWVLAGAAAEWAARIKLFSAPLREALSRAAGLPRAAYGTLLGHAGVGISVIGIVATTAWQSETVIALKPGERGEVAGYTFVLRGMKNERGPNYAEQVGRLEVTRGRIARYRAAALQAPLRHPAPGHHRGRHPRLLARRSLPGAGRRADRWRLRRARLFQPAGPLHLARRHCHVARRRPIAPRPPPAHRRPASQRACPGRRGALRLRSDAMIGRMANGEWRMDLRPVTIGHWPFAIRLLLALFTALSPAHAVEPGEMLKDPALEARARAAVAGAALRGLPEPVDR